MVQECNERLLDDVVRIDLIRSRECNFPVPVMIPRIQEMGGITLGQPVLSLAYSIEAGADALYKASFESAPTMRYTECSETAGVIMTYEGSITVDSGYDDVYEAAQLLAGQDFICILTLAGGERLLVYALPNTSVLTIDDQLSNLRTTTVKVAAKSRSGYIKIGSL